MALLPVIKSNEGSGGLLPVIKATTQPIAPAKPLPLQPKIAAAKPLPTPAPIQAAQPLQADNTNIPVVGDYSKLGQLVKQKYPEYQTMDDEELGKRTIAKYPEYAYATRTPETPKETGFVQSLAQGIAQTPIQVYKAASSLIPAVQSKFTQDETKKKQLEDEAFRRAYGTTDAGYFGQVQPANYQDALGAIGKGGELGSYFIGGGAVKNLAEQGFKQGIKRAAIQGFKTGLGEGFLGGVSTGLQDENRSFGSVLGSGVVGSVGGGVLGGTVGAGAGVVRGIGTLSGKVPDVLPEPTFKPSPTKYALGKTLQAVGGDSESGLRGYAARQGRNFERVATEKPIIDSNTASLAKVAGIDDTIARDIQALNPETKQILSKMTDEAAATGRSLKPKNRMEYVGQEVAKRASQLDTVLKGLKNKYNAAIVSSNVDKGLVKEDIFNTATELAQALESQGVVVQPKGELDFTDSVLNSANLTSEREAIKSIWKELMRASNTEDTPLVRLHNIEKYITGTELPKLPMSNEAKGIITQVRNSIRDKIDARVGGKYQKLVGDYRKAKAVEEQIDGIVNSTITDAKSAGLLSTQEANDLVAKDIANKLTRLTNKAGVKISTFLEAMDNGLGQLGIKNKPIDYETIANFNELLDDIVGSSQRGSLTGRLQRQVAGGIQMAQDIATGNAKGVTDKIMGGIVDRLGSVSHEEKIRALKLLLSNTDKKGLKLNFNSAEATKAKGKLQLTDKYKTNNLYSATGAAAGIEKDENGNYKFDPKRAAVGFALGTIGGNLAKNPKKLYHGTSADFLPESIKAGSYFSESVNYAKRYTNPSASSIAVTPETISAKLAGAPKVLEYNVPKNFNIFDIKNPSHANLIKDYWNEASVSGQQVKTHSGSIDWTEAENLADWLEQKGLNFDGIRVDEGSDLNGKRPTSIKVLKPEKLLSTKSKMNPINTINNVNPTGGIFTEYSPETRMSARLGENITTLDKTLNVKPDSKITIYRGTVMNQNKINAGDFVTTNKQLAKDYAGTGKVIEMVVKASDLLDNIDEPLGEEYIFRPQKNQQ